MERNWIFLQNPFLNVTRTSYRLMNQLGNYTLAALESAQKDAPAATTIFSELANILDPVYKDYNNAYENWLSQQGILKGNTQSLNELLNELSSTRIEYWDLAIQQVYRQKSPAYTALLPHRRNPFQRGSQQNRISVIAALSLAIGSNSKLQNIKEDVDIFYDKLVKANITQKGSKTRKGGISSEVEDKRILLGTALYGALGSLMNYYKYTPEVIRNFFYMPALHAREQTIFNHKVNISQTLVALTRTFGEGEQVKLVNRNFAPLQAALVANKNTPMPATAITISANEEEIVNPAALGPKGNRFLIVKNMSHSEVGAYTIELL